MQRVASQSPNRYVGMGTIAISLIACGPEFCFAADLEPAPSAVQQETSPGAQMAESNNLAEVRPTKEQCIGAHRACQEAQNEGHLVAARDKARICTHQDCPNLLVTDCARWAVELDERTPSIIFEARVDGELTTSVQIDVDGAPVEEWTRGEALRLDLGKHQVRFALPPYPPVVQTVLLGEGMRFRLVSAEFKSPQALEAATSTPTVASESSVTSIRARPVPFLVYPLLGVGAAGLAGFFAFASVGKAEHENLSKTCAPYCTEDQINKMRVEYVMGDISLGVGAIALVSAGAAYLTRPTHVVSPTVGFTTLPHGAMATMTWGGL